MVPVIWLVENHVILVDEMPEVTQDMAIQINAEIVNLLNASTEQPIHLIFTTTTTQKVPTNIFWLSEHMTFVRHPKYGYNITITASPMLKFLGRTLYKISGKRIPRFVTTYAEAKTLLATLDPTLPDLPEALPTHSS